MATKEELIAQGFDEETAELLAETSGVSSGGSLPYPVMKFSYDQQDILVDKGVKKGSFISGWKIDNKKLEVIEEGVVLPEPLDFFIVSSVYQCNHFDTQTRSTDVQTDIFYSPYDTPKMIDKKSGKTIKELKAEKKKIVFNNIILMMVKGEDGKYTPYIHYIHGTNYHTWSDQLQELGVSDDAITLRTNFSIKPKKVPTDYQPAWVFDVLSATARTPEEIQGSIPEVSEAVKSFNKWIKSTNAGETTAAKNEEVGATKTSVAPISADEVDVDDIPFD